MNSAHSGTAAAFTARGERGRARRHYGSQHLREEQLHYEIVNVAQIAPVDPALDADAQADAIAPGAYATVVLKLPASRAADGRALPCGFYAVLWPMHDDAPKYEILPRYIGPFPSAGRASEFIREAAVPW